MEPNYKDVGLSSCMGTQLRQEVESQLLRYLLVYRKDNENLFFDWSDSCIEGKCVRFLDGLAQNFSGIQLFDSSEKLIAHGWMDFGIDQNKEMLLIYWDQLDLFEKYLALERARRFRMRIS